MVISLDVSFLYNALPVGLSAERANLAGPLVLRALENWTFKDTLNKINELSFDISKNDLDRSKLFLERDVYINSFDFKGIITKIADINDSKLRITVSEEGWHFTRRIYKIEDAFKEYNLVLVSPASLPTFIQAIITSANADMPFTWELGEDIPATSDFDFDVKWKNYYQVLRLVAINSLNDVWFEKRKVYIGKKGKVIELDRDDKIYENLSSKIDLNTYGNIVNVVGAEVSGTNVHSSASDNGIDLLYNYERVVSNNNLKTQASVDSVVDRVLADFNNINPDVNINVKKETIYKYKMESGDVIKIISNNDTQTVKGYYRLISVITSDNVCSLKLQYSKDGKFIPRISDFLDIWNTVLEKIHDLELNT